MLIIMFIAIIFLFIIGAPILIGLGMGTTVGILLDGTFPLELIPQRMFTGLDSWPILAIPLFMLAGNLMDQGGMSKKIVDCASAWLGFIKGSLAMVCVATSMVFAGISGSSTADTAAVGSILMPSMKEKGYDMRFATVLQAGAGAIGPIIPPSILMVLIGYSTSTSVGKLFLCGIIPGILVGLSLILYSYIHVRRHKGDPGAAYAKTEKFNLKKSPKNNMGSTAWHHAPFYYYFRYCWRGLYCYRRCWYSGALRIDRRIVCL